MDIFWENQKSPKKAFLAIFEPSLAMFLRSQTYDFDVTAHAMALLGVEWPF